MSGGNLWPDDAERVRKAVVAKLARTSYPAEDAQFLGAVKRANPFASRTFNLSAQMRVQRLAPRLAASLEASTH